MIGKVNETSLGILKSYFLDATSGILTILGKPVHSVSEGFYKINDLVYLYSQNQDLKEENISLNKWKDLALKLLAENEELKKLLKKPCIVDARNIFSIDKLKTENFLFENVGRNL